MNARTIMTSPAIVCRPSDSLETAARLMWQHDIGSLPVVDDDGSLVGIITDRDACMGAYTQGEALERVGVDRVMSRAPKSAGPGDSLKEVERLFREHQVHRLPVVDRRGRVVGILSINDLVRAAHASELRADDIEFVRTMAAVCAPRRAQEGARL